MPFTNAVPTTPGKPRVLAVRLEVAAAARRALDVHRRAERDTDTLAPGLGRDQAAQPVHEVDIPGCCERGRRGKARRTVALIPGRAAHTGRAIRHHDRLEADLGLVVQGPERGAGQQPHLLLQREPCEQRGDGGLVAGGVRGGHERIGFGHFGGFDRFGGGCRGGGCFRCRVHGCLAFRAWMCRGGSGCSERVVRYLTDLIGMTARAPRIAMTMPIGNSGA